MRDNSDIMTLKAPELLLPAGSLDKMRAAYDFDEPAVAIIKHNNTCGIAVGSASAADPIADAHAGSGDPPRARNGRGTTPPGLNGS